MKTYEERKEEARREAMEYQENAGARPLYMSEVAEASAYFYKLGKRLGLVKEYRENGII